MIKIVFQAPKSTLFPCDQRETCESGRILEPPFVSPVRHRMMTARCGIIHGFRKTRDGKWKMGKHGIIQPKKTYKCIFSYATSIGWTHSPGLIFERDTKAPEKAV
jgi:hypothetical protein